MIPLLATLAYLLTATNGGPYIAIGLPMPATLASAITTHRCRAHRKKAIRLRRCLSDGVIHHG